MAQPDSIFIRRDSTDIFHNMAVEEHLFDQIQPGQCRLLLWQSRPAVVIGRNQVPWRECLLSQLPEMGVTLARRRTGGGAVWHDAGNINFSFILDRKLYDYNRQAGMIVDAIKSLGIDAAPGPHRVINVGDRKVSGCAMRLSKGRALHHGTLLVSSDLARLREVLQPEESEITCRAVASRPANVVNLSEIVPDVTVEKVTDALAAAFSAEYGVTESAGEVDDITDDRDIAARRIMLSSDEWVLGETPTFDVTWDIVDNAGTNRLKMRVERGSIVEATAYGSGAEAVAKALEGQPFDRPKIRKILASL